MLFLTDPDRTPEPWRIAERLPEGAGVVFRAFGQPDAVDVGERLAGTCRDRGLVLLVGADESLAERLSAHGVHLPERDVSRGLGLRTRRPDWLVTGAAHSAEALEDAGAAGLDAAILSPVLPSRSPSAGAPLGLEAFGRLVASARLPVFALGGVNAATAPALVGSGACGLAAVSGFSEY